MMIVVPSSGVRSGERGIRVRAAALFLGSNRSRQQERKTMTSMDQMDVDDLPAISQPAFLALLRDYLLDQAERVGRASRTGAGWEIWLQVELYLFARWETHGDIQREKPYGSNAKGRTDFLLNDSQAKGRTLVEIKTRLPGEGAADFLKRFGGDFDKQTTAPKGTRTLVVGVWVGPDLRKTLNQPKKAIGSGEVMIITEVVPDHIYIVQGGIA
jgi:hypothetical protein